MLETIFALTQIGFRDFHFTVQLTTKHFLGISIDAYEYRFSSSILLCTESEKQISRKHFSD